MKISFCTTCMGRLHHLRQTLPINIQNTEKYANREFIIVNYGSKDELHSWAKENLKFWIKRGIVKYYRTREPEYFSATHAKNIAHKQATGDILCNLDADNFILEGFAELLNETIGQRPGIVLSPPTDEFGEAGSCGKIAIRKEHFYSVNGYDESWNIGWGWEDTNFQCRARMHNNLDHYVLPKKWGKVIAHSNKSRGQNFRDQDIFKTQIMCCEQLNKTIENCDFIANKDKNWGYAADLSSEL